MLTLPAENLAVIFGSTLKSNCKHVPADGVVRARKNANVLLTGEVTGKNVTGTVKVFKKDQ